MYVRCWYSRARWRGWKGIIWLVSGLGYSGLRSASSFIAGAEGVTTASGSSAAYLARDTSCQSTCSDDERMLYLNYSCTILSAILHTVQTFISLCQASSCMLFFLHWHYCCVFIVSLREKCAEWLWMIPFPVVPCSRGLWARWGSRDTNPWTCICPPAEPSPFLHTRL